MFDVPHKAAAVESFHGILKILTILYSRKKQKSQIRSMTSITPQFTTNTNY